MTNFGKDIKLTREQINAALEIVERECRQRRICEGCIFNGGFNKDGKRKCKLANYPGKWNLANKEESE